MVFLKSETDSAINRNEQKKKTRSMISKQNKEDSGPPTPHTHTKKERKETFFFKLVLLADQPNCFTALINDFLRPDRKSTMDGWPPLLPQAQRST